MTLQTILTLTGAWPLLRLVRRWRPACWPYKGRCVPLWPARNLRLRRW